MPYYLRQVFLYAFRFDAYIKSKKSPPILPFYRLVGGDIKITYRNIPESSGLSDFFVLTRIKVVTAPAIRITAMTAIIIQIVLFWDFSSLLLSILSITSELSSELSESSLQIAYVPKFEIVADMFFPSSHTPDSIITLLTYS